MEEVDVGGVRKEGGILLSFKGMELATKVICILPKSAKEGV